MTPTSETTTPTGTATADPTETAAATETLAHVAWVARSVVPTTTLSSVSGAVTRPGVVDGAIGGRLGDILAAAGPGPGPVLVGGHHGAWAPADARDAPFTRTDLAAYGRQVGCGRAPRAGPAHLVARPHPRGGDLPRAGIGTPVRALRQRAAPARRDRRAAGRV